MKKTLIALALAGMTTSAYASKARVEALGQNADDNYFIKDSRSIWYNVSNIHDYKDMVLVELGANGQAGTDLDGEANPKAQGGFFRSSGNAVYGVYLGEEQNTSMLLRHTAETAGATTIDLLKPDNVVDLFYGMEMGSMRWAANFLYSKSEVENGATPTSNREQTAMAVRLGASTDMWEAHANLSLKGETKTSAATPEEFDGSLGLHLGGSYKLGGGKVIANYKSLKWDIKNATHTTAVEAKYSQMWLGYGHEQEVAGGTLYSQVYYRSTKVEAPFTTAAGAAELKHTLIPLVVGYEAKANDWLTLRGSVSANLQGKVENKGINAANFNATVAAVLAGAFDATQNTALETRKETIDGAVAVSAGATLNFGKLSVDGLIGTTGSNRGTGDVGNTNGVLSMDNLLTRVGMSYAF